MFQNLPFLSVHILYRRSKEQIRQIERELIYNIHIKIILKLKIVELLLLLSKLSLLLMCYLPLRSHILRGDPDFVSKSREKKIVYCSVM